MALLVEFGTRYVAFFDLLGFSSWLEADGSLEVFKYVRGFLNLMIRASLPGSVVNADMSVTLGDSKIACINFSDSIVFYTRDDSEECLSEILCVSGAFMNVVITGPSRMIRGGIAQGEFYADPEANAYVGQALVDAYRLEGAQDWLSCSIHSSIAHRPQFAGVLKKYPNFVVRALVPLRGTDEVPYCLNWGDKGQFSHISFSAERGLADCDKRARKALAGNAAELKKLERRVKNTREFLLHYNAREPENRNA